MKLYEKVDYPLAEVRRYLEPGPVVLVSSEWNGERNIMTMGWHMMLGFSPALFACYIWPGNHSYNMLRQSRQCVINVPTIELLDKVVGIGNCSGTDGDKFERFSLTASRGEFVDAPLIDECYANFECRLTDASQIGRYDLFIWEVVKAQVAVSPALPDTMHYLGNGEFMIAGHCVDRRTKFKPQNL